MGSTISEYISIKTFFILLLIVYSTNLLAQPDSVFILIRNNITNKNLDIDYTLNLNTEKDILLKTQNSFPKTALPSLEPGQKAYLNLILADYQLEYSLKSESINDLSYFLFILDFETPKDSICNVLYCMNPSLEVIKTCFSPNDNPALDCNCTNQKEHILALGYPHFDSYHGSDWYFEDYLSTLQGYFKKYHGDYKIEIDSTEIIFQIKDSCQVDIYVSEQNNKSSLGSMEWYFDSNTRLIHFVSNEDNLSKLQQILKQDIQDCVINTNGTGESKHSLHCYPLINRKKVKKISIPINRKDE